MFTQEFARFVCDGDSITCHVGGFDVTAHIERDDHGDAPDERQDGFWPSLDPDDAGWIGDKSLADLEAAQADAQRIMDAWKNDEWFYCGVCLTVAKNGVNLMPPYANALWGVECNYPGADNGYLQEVANELLDEALASARAKLAELCANNC